MQPHEQQQSDVTVLAVTLLGVKEVQRRTNLSRSTIFRLEAQGQFPRRCRVSPGRVAWSSAAIDAFIAAKLKEGQ